MRWLNVSKSLIPPVLMPLALSVFVSLAGPGGVVEVNGDHGPQPDANGSVITSGEAIDGEVDVPEPPEATLTPVATATTMTNAGVDRPDADAGVGCEQALAERAQSRVRLEEHVADGDMSSGGASGNQNAVDRQCGGAFADGSADMTTPAPDGTDPGKSEQARGGLSASGQAQGQGQANADASGLGPAGAPGQNTP